MTTIAFIIPLIFAIFLLVFFRQKVVWWEYLIIVLPSMFIAGCLYFGMISYTTSDTEYYGNYVTGIKYYEPWDEYIHRTCTRTVGSGKNQTTESYDCSYVENHGPEWKQTLNNGYEYSISNKEYNRLFSLWNTENSFIDMHRNYDSQDGDCYSKLWDGNISHSKTRTIDHKYENKIKGSKSIFGFENITPDEAKILGLYDYPSLYNQSNGGFFNSDNDSNQSPFLGYKPSKDELVQWGFINGYYGHRNQFRTYNLVFYNKPLSIVQDQRSYWEGGNKNELVTCICLDSTSKKILWVDAFSWCDKPTYEVNLKSYFNGKEKLDFIEFANWTKAAIPQYWKRKEFKDFNYIDIQLTGTQFMWTLIIIFVFNLGMSIYVVLNDEEN